MVNTINAFTQAFTKIADAQKNAKGIAAAGTETQQTSASHKSFKNTLAEALDELKTKFVETEHDVKAAAEGKKDMTLMVTQVAETSIQLESGIRVIETAKGSLNKLVDMNI